MSGEHAEQGAAVRPMETNTSVPATLTQRLAQVGEALSALAPCESKAFGTAMRGMEGLVAQVEAQAEILRGEAEAEAARIKAEEERLKKEAEEAEARKRELKSREEMSKVALEVERVVDLVHRLASGVSDLEVEGEGTDAALSRQVVERLQKDTLRYGETLMQDLLRLDAIDAETLRPARKEQVKRIQTTLDLIEGLRERLGEAHRRIEVRMKAEEEMSTTSDADEEEAAEERVQDMDGEDDDHAEEEDAAEERVRVVTEEDEAPLTVDDIHWEHIPLQLDFSVRQLAEATVLESRAPGLDRQSVRIGIQGDVLRVQGVVKPDAQTFARMVSHCRSRDVSLQEVSRGHFGAFESSFRVRPDLMRMHDAYAQIKHGVLQVIIPRARKTQPMWW